MITNPPQRKERQLPVMDACKIFLIGGLCVVMGAIVLCAILFIVGETVEHFAP